MMVSEPLILVRRNHSLICSGRGVGIFKKKKKGKMLNYYASLDDDSLLL